MKKYHVNVWVTLYADSAEVAEREVRNCLNTGQGHIHTYKIYDVKENIPTGYPLPCGCEIYQNCKQCRGE